MFGFIVIALLATWAYLLKQYLKILTEISSIDIEQQKQLGLTILERKLTSYILLKDIKFLICLFTKSYARSDASVDLKQQLNQARKYLLFQYPVVIALFFTPQFYA